MVPLKSIERQIDEQIETDIDIYMEERENEQFKWGEPTQTEFGGGSWDDSLGPQET